MPRKKRKPNTWQQKKTENAAKGLVTGEEPVGKVKISDLDKKMGEKIDLAIRSQIFPLQFLMDQRHKLLENVEANQIALQTILNEKGVITREELVIEYNKVLKEVIGLVDRAGMMEGLVEIEMYNMGEESENSIHQ